MAVIGLLHSGSKKNFIKPVAALTKALGKGVTIKSEYAEDKLEKMRIIAEELVRDPSVEVIVAAGGPEPALAALRASDRLQRTKPRQDRKPIVFTAVTDPKGSGLVKTLKKPGGNATGMAGHTSELDPERLKLLNQLVPRDGKTRARTFGVLTRKGREHVAAQYAAVKKEAKKLGLKLKRANVDTDKGVEQAFEAFQKQTVAVVVTADAFFNNRRAQIVALAARHKLPAIYQWREFGDAGGLVSFGPSLLEAYEKAGACAAKILAGKKPSQIPVSNPSKFDLFVNSETAQKLGIKVPKALGGHKIQPIKKAKSKK